MLTSTEESRPASLISFFDDFYTSFIQASSSSLDRFIHIGGLKIKLVFANSILEEKLFPALSHLEDPRPSSHEGLTIGVFDSETTGVSVPRPPWSNSDYVTRGEIRHFQSAEVLVSFNLASCALSLLKPDRKTALFWVSDGSLLPTFESGSPLRTLFHWWTWINGLALVHSAAVGLPSGGVLIAGASGRGKSTTALSCLPSRLQFAGDDYVVVDTEKLLIHPLYTSAKIHSQQITRLNFLRSIATTENVQLDNEKHVVQLSSHFPTSKIAADFPLRAIFVPEIISESDSRLEPLSALDAIRLIAPSTLFQMPEGQRDLFPRIVSLVKAVPCFRLFCGSNVQSPSQVILEYLDSRDAS